LLKQYYWNAPRSRVVGHGTCQINIDKLIELIQEFVQRKQHVLYQLLPPERHSGYSTYLEQENMSSV